METNRPDYTETLTRHGIRPTAVRLLIYKTALRFHDTFSMSELEDALESVDKSTASARCRSSLHGTCCTRSKTAAA